MGPLQPFGTAAAHAKPPVQCDGGSSITSGTHCASLPGEDSGAPSEVALVTSAPLSPAASLAPSRAASVASPAVASSPTVSFVATLKAWPPQAGMTISALATAALAQMGFMA